MVKVTTDIRFDITPVEDWPDDKKPDLTISLISYVDRELTVDIERALQFIDIAERNQLWKFVGKKSLAELFERRDLTLEAIEQYRQGVQLLRDKGYQGKITKEQATKAAIAEAKAKPLPTHGGDRKSKPKPDQGDNITLKTDRGTDTEYTLRRLARDAPQLLDKIEAGELSVNAAAIQAGIRRRPKPEEVIVRSFGKMEPSDRITVMRTLLDALSDDERRQVMQG